MTQPNTPPERVLITGGAAGIGAAIAERRRAGQTCAQTQQTGERAGSGGAVKGCEQGAHTPATPTVMPPQTYRTCPVTKPLRASSR